MSFTKAFPEQFNTNSQHETNIPHVWSNLQLTTQKSAQISILEKEINYANNSKICINHSSNYAVNFTTWKRQQHNRGSSSAASKKQKSISIKCCDILMEYKTQCYQFYVTKIKFTTRWNSTGCHQQLCLHLLWPWPFDLSFKNLISMSPGPGTDVTWFWWN